MPYFPPKVSLQPSAVRGDHHLQVSDLLMTDCWSPETPLSLISSQTFEARVVSHFLIPREETASLDSEAQFTVWMFEKVKCNCIMMCQLVLSLLGFHFPGGRSHCNYLSSCVRKGWRLVGRCFSDCSYSEVFLLLLSMSERFALNIKNGLRGGSAERAQLFLRSFIL